MQTMHAEASERRKFTVGDLDRMVEAGILDPDEHIELLDGELFLMGRQGPEHRTLTILVRQVVEAAYGREGHVQDHSNLLLDDFNFPEPDVAVIRGEPREYMDRLPTGTDVLLVVEVTVTSHARDRRKIRTYARAGIAEYWILDVPARTLTVHRNPRAEGYRLVEILDDEAEVPLPGTPAKLAVREILP
jgi:Uma2 family endonuclease